jgi:uncharacterized circularly permuted ATP-grasp superfamily protein
MREQRLTFGNRLHCPFLRPLFLERGDVSRVSAVAEAIAAFGERVIRAALEDPTVLDAVGLTDAERSLVALDPGYTFASTASRLDGFLLPDALWFAEYNAESPAGFGYAETLAEVFDGLPIMARFREVYEAEYFRLVPAMLDALLASYRDWGGSAKPPRILIVDFRGVPTWTEFEILQERFEALGVPTVVADPREVTYERGALHAGGRRVDLVYRRALMNDVLAHPDACAPLVRAYSDRAVCMANTFRCKIPHKKAFFAVLTGERHAHMFSRAEHALIRAHVPWTRLVVEGRTDLDGRSVDLLEHARRSRDELVLKPNDEYGGTGVALGWELGDSEWSAALDRALTHAPGTWVLQRRIPVRREEFPMVDEPFAVVMREMLVDLAPYLFRGRVGGFLTRLSTTGLANVTSGGGQVPAFVTVPRGTVRGA